ncbi:MAG: ABC transporter permease [Oscillospiraceae bacterium]
MARQSGSNQIGKTALGVAFWLAVWQLASLAIGEELFLPSPFSVAAALARLVVTGSFWLTVCASLARIGAGFLLGFAAGFLLACAAKAGRWVEVLLRPFMQLVRAVPVASFTILAILWVGSRNLSVFVSFLMVLPVVYSATLTGLAAAPPQLLEMAGVFRVPFFRRARAVYLPALMPSLAGGCELALGLGWKSGVAAEVIGLSSGTIGERLYQAKVYFMTPDVFAWTVVVVALSWGSGKAVLAGLRRLYKAVGGGGPRE